jgi:hypothetical protein
VSFRGLRAALEMPASCARLAVGVNRVLVELLELLVEQQAWLCRSISVMPEVAPKLPSIWNGGWELKRFGWVLPPLPAGASRPLRIRWARSPSARRAQKLIFHALLQPVPPSPRALSETFAAAASSGRADRGDLAAGVHGEQVGDVAVAVVGIVHVLHPFLELAPAADPRPGRRSRRPATRFCGSGIDVEFGGGFDVVGEQIPDDLLVVGSAGLRVAVAFFQTIRPFCFTGPCSGDHPAGVMSLPSGPSTR